MIPSRKTNTNTGVAIGIVLQLFGAANTGTIGALLTIVGSVAFVWGCGNYALGKGYSAWLGLLGMASLIGLIVLVILPDRHKTGKESMAEVDSTSGANDQLLYMCLLVGVLFTGIYFTASLTGAG